jgi:DNA-binding SARP family transcriptional activator
VEFRILGPLEVRHADRPVHVRGAKERALLALLLLHANEPVSADRLIDELWSGAPPPTARKSLQVRVAGLRRALGDDAVVTRGDGYAISVGGDELDLHLFERLLSDGRERLAAADPKAAVQSLEEALALWRGPPLADFTYESFAQAPIARLEELRLTAVELRNEGALALGHHARLIGDLEVLVAANPLRERLGGQLMLALYRDGRQAEALEVYQRIRHELRVELGLDPGPALQRLQQGVLRQEPSLEAVTAVPERSILVAPRDERRLEDVLVLAQALARRPTRELILACLIPPGGDVTATATALNGRRESLANAGVAARVVVFTSAAPGGDLVRIASEQNVDLLLVDGTPDAVANPALEQVLVQAPCDVAILVSREEAPGDGAVVVLFGGGDHDWAAVEVAAWIARSREVTLRLAGPAEGRERDASRTLASASLAVQRALGVAAEPLLVPPREADVLAAVQAAGLVVLGLPARWSRDGLGHIRAAVAENAEPPVLLVRQGLRPSGLAPRESLTRFTWTLAPAH